MKEISKTEIIDKARGYQKADKKWHYHLLTPGCEFNKMGGFALLLEGVDNQEISVHHSDNAEMDTSKSLAELLHGKDVVNPDQSTHLELTAEEQTILDLITELQTAGMKWHHHVFFPGCTFNNHPGQFELVLEDPRSGEHLTAVSDAEPKEALKRVETEFYKQA